MSTLRKNKDNTARISLGDGHHALVDAADVEKLNRYDWKRSRHRYAYRIVAKGGRHTRRYMHREILGFPSGHVDHINGNTLDNCRSNLRVTTPQQNQFNSRKRAPASSHYKGVTVQNGKYVARITLDRKTKYLGQFASEVEAARAYDEAARELFGEYACTNLN